VTPSVLEQPTAILNQPISRPTTDRFDPRPTGAPGVAPLSYGESSAPVFSPSGPPALTQSSGSMRGLIIVIVIFVVLLGLGSVVGVMRSGIISRIQGRSSVSQSINQSLIYPGAQTVLNVDSGGGRGVLQLKTTDSLDKVADWYAATLKPTKTIRVGPTVIMKSDNATATIISDGDNTSIVIKQQAP
jgi:hypothetical protein